ncbi:A-kinase anchor protein 17A isoform X2 [Atheta coriaria]
MIQKLKDLITPDEFASIKVTRTAVDVVRFEAELELEAYVQRVLCKLDNKYIKLQDVTQLLKVKACEAKTDFPTRHEWDAYFRDAKDMNEMKFGERPDTIHISNLPTRWFVNEKFNSKDKDVLPSEKLFYYAFEKFGDIRHVDIPICDPYRHKMKAHISGIQNSSFDDLQFFEGYIQFKEYMGFVDCMNALRGKKLLHKDRLGDSQMIKIFVAFDKSKHLSEAAIRRRDILRERLILRQKSREEVEREKLEAIQRKESAEKQKIDDIKNGKEQRRRQREEKRKAKILAQLKDQEKNDFNQKIAKEEKKLLIVQRRLEAIRLVEDLFKRVESKLDLNVNKPKKEDLAIKDNQLKRMKLDYEQEFSSQREKLTKAVEGRVILRSIVSSTAKEVCSDEESSSADDSIGNPERDAEKIYPTHPLNVNGWYPYWQNPLMAAAAYSAVAPPYYFPHRGRGHPGPSGGNRQFRGGRGRGYNRPYRNKFHTERYSRSRSRSRSKSRYLYRDSRSKSRSKSRSRKRRSYSRSRSKSRSRSRSRSYSRTKRHTSRSTRSRS